MKKNTKVMVIGLDGAAWKLLGPWIDKGELPWFKKLKKNWFSTTLESTLPPLTGSSWVSFQTGVYPAKHGVFDFVHYRKNGKDELVSSLDISYPTIWEWLEYSGKRCCIINMPITYPIKKTKSVVISSLMTPPGKAYASETSIYRKLEKMGYVVDLDEMTFGDFADSIKNKEKLYNQTVRMAQKRTEAALMLLEQDWDFFFVLFKSTDIVQHLFWRSNQTLKFYKMLEVLLQKILAKWQKKAGHEDLVIICSDHGFHPGETMSFSLFRWLEKRRYLKEDRLLFFQGLRLTYSVFRKLFPKGAKSRQLEKIRVSKTKKEVQEKIKRVRNNAKAWPVPFGVYINNQKVKEKIKQELEELNYKGKKVFKKVCTKEELYGKETGSRTPDILFLPNSWVRVDANPFQQSVWQEKKEHFAGNHFADPNGILLINSSSNFVLNKKRQYKIVDIFPTIASIFEQPIPPYCDGEVILKRNKGKIKTKMSDKRSAIQKIIREEIKILSK